MHAHACCGLQVAASQLNSTDLQKLGALLATQYLVLTEAAGKTGGSLTFLMPLMSPAYQIVRADGSRATPVRLAPLRVPAAAACGLHVLRVGYFNYSCSATERPNPTHLPAEPGCLSLASSLSPCPRACPLYACYLHAHPYMPPPCTQAPCMRTA